MTNPEIVLIITTTGGMIVSVVNAVANGWGRKTLNDKTDDVKKTVIEAHTDIVRKGDETIATVNKVGDGSISVLSTKIDGLVDRINHIETWMISERTARTRVTDASVIAARIPEGEQKQ